MKNKREFIKDARKRLGDTQQEFADRLHTSMRTIQGWERQNNPHSPDRMKVHTIKKILQEAGV